MSCSLNESLHKTPQLTLVGGYATSGGSDTLLSKEDVDLINGIGFPLEARPDLHHIGPTGALHLTAKGRQFYQALLSRLGLLHWLPLLKTRSDLYNLKQAGLAILADASLAELLAAARANLIQPQQGEVVNEYLFGTPATFVTACARLDFCNSAGAHIIPVSFKKNTAN